MHALIRNAQDIGRVLQYHQRKLESGKAERITAENFIKDNASLTVPEIQYHFDRLTVRNEKMWKHIFHGIISFDRYEKISNDTMSQVVQEYMGSMRFGEQPLLAYRHYDSPIPHVHLVSSNVREDGTKLQLYLSDLYRSRELTHSLEEKYGLHSSQKQEIELHPVSYGEKPLYTSINKVLESVIPNYSYTSLDELNALLSLYGVVASRGREESFSYKEGGLTYIPIKEGVRDYKHGMQAHTFKSRPTLHNLEQRFAAGDSAREPARSRLATAIDWCLVGPPLSLSAFKEAMSYEGISVVFGQHSNTREPQNCWFVDHQSHTVFAGATLGEKYSAQSLATRCISEEAYQQRQALAQTETQSHHLRL